MSDCFRPTHTLANAKGEPVPYNPTEVRLYGIHGPLPPVSARELVFATPKHQIKVSIEPRGRSEKSGGARRENSSTPDSSGGHLIAISAKEPDWIIWCLAGSYKGSSPVEAGVIYGYAYEGHCYDLPKPKVMIIPAVSTEVPADDCGYSEKPGYRVWVVDKLEQCIEIEVSQGFVEQLVLEANMPGKRSPSTYRATMAMAHRSGRLTE